MKNFKTFLLFTIILSAFALVFAGCGLFDDDDETTTPPPPVPVTSVNLPETGQATCYDVAGGVISCAGTGQDGELQKGVAWPLPRFTDNGDGTITDNLTGLMWLENGDCFGTRVWTDALSDADTLADGTCGLTDGSAAGDWRLPNVNELESLVNAGYSNTSTWLNTQAFSNVPGGYYWSSSTYAADTSRAWVVDMGSGDMGTGLKTSGYYVWPVRAGQ